MRRTGHAPWRWARRGAGPPRLWRVGRPRAPHPRPPLWRWRGPATGIGAPRGLLPPRLRAAARATQEVGAPAPPSSPRSGPDRTVTSTRNHQNSLQPGREEIPFRVSPYGTNSRSSAHYSDDATGAGGDEGVTFVTQVLPRFGTRAGALEAPGRPDGSNKNRFRPQSRLYVLTPCSLLNAPSTTRVCARCRTRAVSAGARAGTGQVALHVRRQQRPPLLDMRPGRHIFRGTSPPHTGPPRVVLGSTCV